jgi:hypothetical protein
MWHKAHMSSTKLRCGRPCVGALPKTVLSTCPAEAVLKVSNAQRWCKEETWPPGQPDKWAPRAQSLAIAPPYSSYKYHGAPPPTESVKRVRFSPLECTRVHSHGEERERGKVLRARGLPVLSGVLRVARARKLYQNPLAFDDVF